MDWRPPGVGPHEEEGRGIRPGPLSIPPRVSSMMMNLRRLLVPWRWQRWSRWHRRGTGQSRCLGFRSTPRRARSPPGRRPGRPRRRRGRPADRTQPTPGGQPRGCRTRARPQRGRRPPRRANRQPRSPVTRALGQAACGDSSSSRIHVEVSKEGRGECPDPLLHVARRPEGASPSNNRVSARALRRRSN